MTSKDRNLTLAATCPPPAASRARRARRPGAMASATLLVLSLNLVCLGGGGYWLYRHADPIAAAADAAAADAAAADAAPAAAAAVTARAVAELRDALRALDARIGHLQLTLDEQRRLGNAALLDIHQQLGALRAVRAGATGAPVPAAGQWLINAGAFAAPQPAATLQQALAALGYTVQITGPGEGDPAAHQVQVTGFADRHAAEQAAARIMAQTDLNGLWVWQHID